MTQSWKNPVPQGPVFALLLLPRARFLGAAELPPLADRVPGRAASRWVARAR